MRILITNNTLSALAGTEGVVVELAKALQARGHEVAACSSHLGEQGALLREEKIVVVREPGDSPFVPDLIHGQHHLDTMRALFHLPDTPAIYHCHGGLPWVERPPCHPRILHYIGMCDGLSGWMRVELGLPEEKVHTIGNWVDLERFHTVACPPDKPRRALVFTRMMKPGFFAGELEAAFRERGISIDLTLPCPDGETRHPESLLPEYDIVLAAGRSALEAMASGCATMIVSNQSCLGFASPGNFDDWRDQNFAPSRSTPQLTRASVGKQLDAYDAAAAAAVTKRVRAEAGLSQAVDALEKIHAAALEDWRGMARPGAEVESRAAARYLQQLMPALRELEGQKRLLDKRDATIRDLKLSLKAQTAAAKGTADSALLRELRRSIPGRLLLHFARKRAEEKP